MIPDVPQPPTDNLYKFMAIAGLALFAASMSVPWHYAFNIKEELYKVMEAQEVLAVDLKHCTEKSHGFSQIITNSILSKKGLFTNSTEKLQLTYSNDELKAMFVELEELRHSIDVKNASGKINFERIKDYTRRHRIFIWVITIGGALSGWLSIRGFRLWYVRIQIYQDKALRLSAQKQSKANPD